MTGDDGLAELNHARARPVRIVAGVVGALLLGVIALLTFSRGGDAVQVSPVVGELVPELRGRTLAGDAFDIDDYRDRWVVVNLFATWCVPCRIEHPELVAFDEEHAPHGDAQLVSVVFGDDDETVRQFFAERGGTWPVLGEEYSSVVIDFGATGVPETFVVAPGGIVVAHTRGGVTRDGLNAIITASQ